METLECIMPDECPIISEGTERELEYDAFGNCSTLGIAELDCSDSSDTGGGDDGEDAPVC
jgi:hypothetical protein